MFLNIREDKPVVSYILELNNSFTKNPNAYVGAVSKEVSLNKPTTKGSKKTAERKGSEQQEANHKAYWGLHCPPSAHGSEGDQSSAPREVVPPFCRTVKGLRNYSHVAL